MPHSIEQQLEDHIKKENDVYSSILDDIQEIKENHLVHLASDISQLKVDLASCKTNIEWVRWGVLTIIGGMIALFLTK
mgnify:CR=1 FL=1